MVDTKKMLSFGFFFVRLVIILVMTIGTIMLIRWILKLRLWPAVIKKKSESIGKIFHLLEITLPSFIVLLGMQSSVRIFSESHSNYAELINNFFFLFI